MNVETAKAQLAMAEASEKYRKAKAAYQADSKKKPAFVKARSLLVDVRNEWRVNHRTAPNGPGDASASPAPINALLEVN